MQTATIREVQHHLSSVLKKVEEGEEIQVLRRSKPIARIVPLKPAGPEASADWTNHASEISRIFGGRIVSGQPMETIVSEGRGDR